MFLCRQHHRIGSISFPRIRGDVPHVLPKRITASTFSPHTRGCSLVTTPHSPWNAVFPAYAGMFRTALFWREIHAGFPRIRGDVPAAVSFFFIFCWFSPHTRGCSAVKMGFFANGEVFPAYAGMFRRYGGAVSIIPRFPRIRGDVPKNGIFDWCFTKFSPHTRGCSVRGRDLLGCRLVFPAYAGMFLCEFFAPRTPIRFPRIRGDVPRYQGRFDAGGTFSPHTRGCSAWYLQALHLKTVFPAYAGMFRI